MNQSAIYSEADHFIRYDKGINPDADEKILPVLDDILENKKGKKLIVIKMLGVHVDFVFRYPDENLSTFRRYLYQLKKKTKEAEMYHYNKAISYSAGIIAKIMKTAENRSEPAMLLFSSDHGICIFDKGYFQTPATCRNGYHIPAMVLLNPALSALTLQKAKDTLKCNENMPLTEDYYFETIAALSGISYPKADKSYDLTEVCDPLNGQKRQLFDFGRVFRYEDL